MEGYTPEQLEGWENYRQELYLNKTNSDDKFEKAINLITKKHKNYGLADPQ